MGIGIYVRVFSGKEFGEEVLEKMLYWSEPYFPRKGEMIGWGLFVHIFEPSDVYGVLSDKIRQKWDACKMREEEMDAKNFEAFGFKSTNQEELCLREWMEGKNFVVSNVVWNYNLHKHVCLDVTIEYD